MANNTLPFLAFPGEIRNRIYTLLLVVPPPSTTTAFGEKARIYPEILRVNKQIHHEALSFLYTKNTFIAHPVRLYRFPQLRRWMDPVEAPHLIALIRRYHVFVRLECDAGFTPEAARDAFSGIEELTVEMFRSQFKGSRNGVLRLFERVRGVRRARVFGSVDPSSKYVAWLQKQMMSTDRSERLAIWRRIRIEGWDNYTQRLKAMQ